MEADSVWRPALAVLLAEIGDVEAARRELKELVDAGLETIPRGGLGVGGLTYVADACALIEDAALAAPIYEQLLAFEGQNMVIGSAVMCYGAADRMLGALATVMRAMGRRRASPRERARPQPAPGIADLDRAHAVRARAAGTPPRRRRSPRRHASECPRRWMRRGGSGCPGSSRASNA